jgi:hypothetical protein
LIALEEAKRLLLLSVYPTVQAGERQRIVDSKASEEFTRCRVEKSYRRGQSYEYVDIDTNALVDYPEYEARLVTSV